MDLYPDVINDIRMQISVWKNTIGRYIAIIVVDNILTTSIKTFSEYYTTLVPKLKSIYK